MFHLAIKAFKHRHARADLLQRKQACLVAVIEVGGGVGDFVGEIDELRFERRAAIQQILGQLRVLFGTVIVGMLDDAFAHFKGEIEAAKGGVAQLEIFDDAQSVQVVIEEKTVLAHGVVEGFFAGMPERGMADVVHQGESLHQIDV